jgi:hypothetical protein
MKATLKIRDQRPGEVCEDVVLKAPPGVVEMLTRLALHQLEEGLKGRDVILAHVDLEVSFHIYESKPDMVWHKSGKPIGPPPEGLTQ